MKRKSCITGKVVDLLFPNKGIVETPEGNAHVKGVIPGQTISFIVAQTQQITPLLRVSMKKIN